MENKIAILYSTVDGQTLKICTHIAQFLENKGFATDLFEITAFTKSVAVYSTVIIGASIRYGKHNKVVTQFVLNHKSALDQIKTAFFSVNLVARNASKNTFNTNPYVVKYLKTLGWTPQIIDVFAGQLDYSAYVFWDKIMIKLIMKLTHGPTKAKHPIEFTDWGRVEDFSLQLIQN